MSKKNNPFNLSYFTRLRVQTLIIMFIHGVLLIVPAVSLYFITFVGVTRLICYVLALLYYFCYIYWCISTRKQNFFYTVPFTNTGNNFWFMFRQFMCLNSIALAFNTFMVTYSADIKTINWRELNLFQLLKRIPLKLIVSLLTGFSAAHINMFTMYYKILFEPTIPGYEFVHYFEQMLYDSISASNKKVTRGCFTNNKGECIFIIC